MSSRYDEASAGRRDDTLATDGDTSFLGVNLKLDPDKLPPGFARRMINKVCRRGTAATRDGICTPVHFNPRMRIESLTDADFFVIAIAHEADAGRDLFLEPFWRTIGGTVYAESSPDIDFVFDNGGPDPLIDTLLAQSGALAGSDEILVYAQNWRTVFAASTEYQLDLWASWQGASHSGGYTGRITITVTPYLGGTMSVSARRYVNTGGTAGTPLVFAVTLMSDGGGGDEAFWRLTWKPGSDKRGFASFNGELKAIATSQIGEPGYAADLPPLLDFMIFGAGKFTDAAGDAWLLLATPTGIWKVADGRTPTVLTTPEPIESAVEIVQFADAVLVFRGEGLVPWEWTGEDDAFAEVNQLDPGGGLRPLPGSSSAEVIANRLVLPQGRDGVQFTGLLTQTVDELLHRFRIQGGTSDSLVRVLPFTNQAALVFMTRSVFLLNQITGTLSEVRLDDVNRALGLAARKACAVVGSDAFFLAGTGVFRISQVVESRIATQPVPVSDPIEPIFRERVNWSAIAGAVMAVHGEYVYLAVPLDGATRNNTLLVFNTTTGQWEGMQIFPRGLLSGEYDDLTETPGYKESCAVTIADLITANYAGAERLFAIDRHKGLVYLLGEGAQDRVWLAQHAIADLIETRGYLLADNGVKQFATADLVLATWAPKFSLAATADGVGERKALITGKTKSRTRYYVHGRPDYVTTNVNDDHATPKREDYSVPAGSGSNYFQLRSGIVFDRRQTAQERRPVKFKGRWLTLEISNTQGRCDLVSTQIEARRLERAPSTRV